MTEAMSTYHLSEIHRKRFGVVTANVFFDDVFHVEGLLNELHERNVKFVIARCDSGKLDLVQELERRGFFIVDTLAYYAFMLDSSCILGGVVDGYEMMAASTKDADEVESLAETIFSSYQGHYHNDPLIKNEDADKVYSTWARSTVDYSGNEITFIVRDLSRELVAFGSIKSISDEVCDASLFGVSPEHQRRGLFGWLLVSSLNWACDNGYSQLQYSTQITNISAQKVVCKLGFKPQYFRYTLHKWL